MATSKPLTSQEAEERSGSPSASKKPSQVQTRASPTTGSLGVMVTPVMLGGMFSITTAALETAAPAAVPSNGVAVQTTSSPLENTPESEEVATPVANPLTIQA